MALIDFNKSEKDKEHKKIKTFMENRDVVKYSFRIPVHLHAKIRQKLITERKSLRTLLLEMVLKYIKE